MSPTPSGSVVLVIDDDETFAEMLTWWLTTRGFAPLTCTSAAEARAAMSDRVVAVVCDIELDDGVVGTTLVEELRRTAGHRAPAVFVSGHRSEFVEIDESRDRFLQKPFDLEALADLLTTLAT